MRAPRHLTAIVIAATLMAAATACADEAGRLPEDPDSELMRRFFEEGARRYDEQDYQGAIAAFEKARRIKPLPAFDFNIGRALDRMARVEEALTAYRRYVSSTPEPK